MSSNAGISALSTIGFTCALALFAAPAPSFFAAALARDVGDTLGSPYLWWSANCLLWVGHCVQVHLPTPPLVTNAVGAALNVCYCLVFVVCTRGEEARKRFRRHAFAAGTAVAAALILSPSTPALLGVLAPCVNVAAFGAPLGETLHALKTRNVHALPLPLLAVGLVCSSVWVVYASAIGSPALVVPNALGVLLSAFQLSVRLWFRNSPETTAAAAAAARGAVVRNEPATDWAHDAEPLLPQPQSVVVRSGEDD